MKVSGQMRRKLGTNAKPSQQYWYHETWCGQPIETDETDEAQALSEDIQSSSKPLLEQTSNFQYDINKSNSGVVFGGVSGRQIVVFSVMHATDSSSSADSVSTVPEKEQHDHSGNSCVYLSN